MSVGTVTVNLPSVTGTRVSTTVPRTTFTSVMFSGTTVPVISVTSDTLPVHDAITATPSVAKRIDLIFIILIFIGYQHISSFTYKKEKHSKIMKFPFTYKTTKSKKG